VHTQVLMLLPLDNVGYSAIFENFEVLGFEGFGFLFFVHVLLWASYRLND